MRWKGRRKSTNVEDRRGEAPVSSGRKMGLAGGGLGIAKILFSLFSRGSGKTKMFMIVALVLGFILFKGPLMSMLGGSAQPQQSQAQSGKYNPGKVGKDDEYKEFISVILGANEDTWKRIFKPAYGVRYQPAKLIIYTNGTRMEDGSVADARMGPFYLPTEKRIYLDPSFFVEMRDNFGVDGEFARAYVISHEFGHHLQNLLGLTGKLHSQHGKISKKKYNEESVRLELHADFLAGIFAHHDDKNFNSIDRADIQKAMACAKAIGDDRLQQQAGQRVSPESFTHGTSEQRSKWFMRGYNSGNPRDGDKIYSMDYDDL